MDLTKILSLITLITIVARKLSNIFKKDTPNEKTPNEQKLK